MKKIWVKLGVTALALIMAVVFAGCDNGGGGGRTAVRDGTFITYGFGWNLITPMRVSTTFARNTLVRVAVVAHDETGPLLDSATERFIPRMIQSQSTGVDNITGATASSMGIRTAVEEAIYLAGGRPEQWRVTPPRQNRTVVLPSDGGAPYDVIVVGLGGTGAAAFMSAAQQPNTTVFGIEWAAKIGGTSVTAGGGFALNSPVMQAFYGLPTVTHPNAAPGDYSGPIDGPGGWLEQMYGHFGETGFLERDGDGWAGGARMNVVDTFLRESGPTICWMMGSPFYFTFARPAVFGMAGGLPRPFLGPVVHNHANHRWIPGPGGNLGGGGFQNDDTLDLHKTLMFTRAVNTARAMNPRNDFQLELRAREILTDDNGAIIGVRAEYRDGTTFMIMGRTVILATGGFIANPVMTQRYLGAVVRPYAVYTNVGDGIEMARALGGATYNIRMAGAVHNAHLRNLIQATIPHPLVTNRQIDGEWKHDLASLLLRPQSMVIATAVGHDGVDRRGRRFAPEVTAADARPPVTDHAEIRIPMPAPVSSGNARAGGFFAAIFSDDILYAFEDNAIGGNAGTMWFQLPQVPIGTARPTTRTVPHIRPLIQWAVDTGNAVRAPTIPALAQLLGVDAEILAAEIARYNDFVESGVDEDWSKPGANLVQVVNPNATGFTAILGAGYFYGTSGGLDVNPRMQVVDINGVGIPGLFAGGQDTQGVLHHRYRLYSTLGGKAHGWALTSGRLAAINAAADAAAMR